MKKLVFLIVLSSLFVLLGTAEKASAAQPGVGLKVQVLASLPSTGAPPPPAPTNVLSWQDPNTGTTAINVYRSSATGAEGFYQQITWTGTEPLTWTDSTPLVGLNFYKITAVVGGKESGPSNEASAQDPVPPSGLSAK